MKAEQRLEAPSQGTPRLASEEGKEGFSLRALLTSWILDFCPDLWENRLLLPEATSFVVNGKKCSSLRELIHSRFHGGSDCTELGFGLTFALYSGTSQVRKEIHSRDGEAEAQKGAGCHLVARKGPEPRTLTLLVLHPGSFLTKSRVGKMRRTGQP